MMPDGRTNAPILNAYSVGDGKCAVWCKHCGLWHVTETFRPTLYGGLFFLASTSVLALVAQTVMSPFGPEVSPTVQTFTNGGVRFILGPTPFSQFGVPGSSRQFIGR